ncbi:MAG: glycoside hydrolase family 172 protein [Promethearchaeota archaeon]
MSKEELKDEIGEPNFLRKIGPISDHEIGELEKLPQLKNHRVYQVTTTHHDQLIQKMGTWRKFHKQGVKHRDQVIIRPNSSYVFEELKGPGKITNIWMTAMPLIKDSKRKPVDPDKISLPLIVKTFKSLVRVSIYKKFPHLLRKFYIRIYFDDSETPSVNAPIGIFFGSGFGRYNHHISRYMGMTGGGYVSLFRMPFKKKARVEIVNTSKKRACLAFYGAITYNRYENEALIKDMGYFHAWYHEEKPTLIGKPYLILEKENGKGHFIGLVLNCRNIKRRHGFAYLEGNTKFYIDGETSPSIEFTGTEDLFQGAWYYICSNRGQAKFYTPYHGLTYKSFNRAGQIIPFFFAKFSHCKTSQYRFFPEGIPFKEKIKIIIHHGEFDEIPTHYESLGFFYFDKP